MEWNIKTFDELTAEELYEILQIRVDVFVVEQACIYRELDGLDQKACHMIARDGSRIAAYARILPPGLSYDELSFGRVLVAESHRRLGIGTELIKRVISFIRHELNGRVVKISAQEYLLDFYKTFGFQQASDVYLDEGIPHIDMVLKMDQ